MRQDVCACSLELPPHLGGLIASYGALLEYRVTYTGSRASVTLVYGDPVPPKTGRWRRRRRATGKAQGEPKPAAKPPAATPSVAPPTAVPRKKTGSEEAPAPDVPTSTKGLTRPTPQARTSAPPVVPPIIQAAPVEAPARKIAMVKRKATTPPSGQPDKPGPPSQPPKPDMDGDEPWSLKAGKLTARHAQLSKTNIEDVNFSLHAT
ncbi:atherin-like [Gigantopelta aegis]|uniref:atherin-like n=1 Tax=Gigantopelta aegis TaxID=1735272 RepID=UPI001B88B472|nr:atherin-like [Gigantopelta aegis]